MESKVSVIIPVYNAEKFLRRTLNSVVNQTLKNIEIICVNDGSIDKSGEILDEYALKDRRFKILHQENLGSNVANYKSLNMANSKYIMFLDHDDELAPNALEKMFKLIDKYDLVMCETEMNIQNGYNHQFYPFKDKMQMFFMRGIQTDIWAKLYKKELLDPQIFANPIFVDKKPFYMHLIVLFNAILKARNIVYINEFLHIYNEEINSHSKTINFLWQYKGICAVLDKIEKMTKNVYKNKYLKDFLYFKIMFMNHFMNKIISSRKFNPTEISKVFSQNLSDLHHRKNIYIIKNTSSYQYMSFLFNIFYARLNTKNKKIKKMLSRIIPKKDYRLCKKYKNMIVNLDTQNFYIKYIISNLKNIKIVNIYGGGGLGDKFKIELDKKNITINALIDTNAKEKDIFKFGLKAKTIDKLDYKDRNIKIIIASLSYNITISQIVRLANLKTV